MKISVVSESRSYSVDLTEGATATITVGKHQAFRVVLSNNNNQPTNSWFLTSEVPDTDLVSVFVGDDTVPRLLGPGETFVLFYFGGKDYTTRKGN